MLFKELKELFIAELILKIYILSLPTVVKIDVLDFALGAYLIQKYLNRWHLVTYYSCKMTPLELNYNIYNKELLGIVTVLKEWRAFLYNIIELFRVITDYKNLVKFLIIKELNYKQVRWAKEFIKYYFKIKYIKGTENARADILNKKAEL